MKGGLPVILNISVIINKGGEGLRHLSSIIELWTVLRFMQIIVKRSEVAYEKNISIL